MEISKAVVGSVLAVATACFLASSPVSAHQTASQQFPSLPSQTSSSQSHDPHRQDPSGEVHQRFEEEAAKARNTERFKRIQTDTAKLLQLSTELKSDVDKSTKNEMSLDVIRKAAEIEKLAHDVKDRMKG